MRAFALLMALCAVSLAGCGGGSGDESAPVPAAKDTAASEGAARPNAPPIAGTTLDGEQMSLAGLRGRQVFVNVWSSW